MDRAPTIFEGREGRPAHSDMRRSIYETEARLPDGSYRRMTTIQVGSFGARLGDHYHPDTETFVVAQGEGVLYLASADNPSNVMSAEFKLGNVIVIPGGMVHTFMCDPKTTLVAITDWPFTEGSIVPCELTLPD